MIDRDRLVNAFCGLVRIDSPSDEEEDMARHLTQRLEGLGFRVDRDAHGNVIASEDGENPLLLSAHMDTVEPGRGIKPQVNGDRIVSDGTTILGGDCKAGVASILEALEASAEDGTHRRPVQVVFTRGEEIGLVGANNLDYSMIKAKESVVFDGNGPVNTITGASPSYVSFDVTVKGRAAHAGVEPEKGLSAIRIVTEIIQELPQGRLDEETTFNVGMISGGSVRNAVPSDAAFGGEFRSRNIETLDSLRMQVVSTLEAARKKYSDATIQEDLDVLFHM
ncbi:MAG: M20/M25/M40 family metallo-hydrolase, partial [Proteobacteria bacterium]|nr:M20/M25/M40 family metallo-hydrolase [Pseudomonadota bacterium]